MRAQPIFFVPVILSAALQSVTGFAAIPFNASCDELLKNPKDTQGGLEYYAGIEDVSTKVDQLKKCDPEQKYFHAKDLDALVIEGYGSEASFISRRPRLRPHIETSGMISTSTRATAPWER